MFFFFFRRKENTTNSRITVSKEFRCAVLQTLPILEHNHDYLAFTQYLLFPSKITKQGTILIDWETIYNILGKKKKGQHFNCIAFLDQYNKDTKLEIQWKEHSYLERQAREITCINWPAELVYELAIERKTLYRKTGSVYFITGLTVTAQRQKEHRMLDKTQALEEMAVAGCKEAEELLDYMNNLPPNRFKSFLTKLDRAAALAETIEDTATRNRQLDILRAIAVQPMPFYKPTKRTVRISSSNESILRLKRDVRSVLTDGLISIDLTHAQLAIAATVWNIPTLLELLKAQTQMWNYLWDHLGRPSNITEVKPIIKRAIYAMMFGMSKESLRNGNDDFEGLNTLLKPYDRDANDFLSIPIIKDILLARAAVYADITNEGGARDIFNRWISISRETAVNSVAAQVLQSYELYLMMPIVRAARITKEFTIVLWLHDGCYIDVKDNRRLDLWVDRIYTLVQENAERLGIITSLEIK